MGGEGVWRLAISDPDRFAAIAPICGDAPQEKAEHVERIKVCGHLAQYLSHIHFSFGCVLLTSQLQHTFMQHLPIWVFHGVQDTVVPFDDSQRMVEALRQVRAKDVKFTEYHDVAHDAWTGKDRQRDSTRCAFFVCLFVCLFLRYQQLPSLFSLFNNKQIPTTILNCISGSYHTRKPKWRCDLITHTHTHKARVWGLMMFSNNFLYIQHLL